MVQGGRRQRPWIPSGLGAAPLLMLPVLTWLALDLLEVTPRRAQPQPVFPHPRLAATAVAAANASLEGAAGLPHAAPLPPPAAKWEYWQQVGPDRRQPQGSSLLSPNTGAPAPPLLNF